MERVRHRKRNTVRSHTWNVKNQTHRYREEIGSCQRGGEAGQWGTQGAGQRYTLPLAGWVGRGVRRSAGGPQLMLLCPAPQSRCERRPYEFSPQENTRRVRRWMLTRHRGDHSTAHTHVRSLHRAPEQLTRCYKTTTSQLNTEEKEKKVTARWELSKDNGNEKEPPGPKCQRRPDRGPLAT